MFIVYTSTLVMTNPSFVARSLHLVLSNSDNFVGHPLALEMTNFDSVSHSYLYWFNISKHYKNIFTPPPHKYVAFAYMFEKKNVDHLLEYQLYYCSIDLLESTCPPFGPIYRLSKLDLEHISIKTLRKAIYFF
jgi:hypothetical protein